MPASVSILRYQSHEMEAVHISGQIWLRGDQIAPPLGYTDERSVRNLYARNADEFTADETRVVPIRTDGGEQKTRVFSLRGVRLLGLLANTKPAKGFRKWILDLLEGRVRQPSAPMQIALPGTHMLPTDTRLLLDEQIAMFNAGELTLEALEAFRSGARALPTNPSLEFLRRQNAALRQQQGDITRGRSRVKQEAKRMGFSEPAVKMPPQAEAPDAS